MGKHVETPKSQSAPEDTPDSGMSSRWRSRFAITRDSLLIRQLPFQNMVTPPNILPPQTPRKTASNSRTLRSTSQTMTPDNPVYMLHTPQMSTPVSRGNASSCSRRNLSAELTTCISQADGDTSSGSNGEAMPETEERSSFDSTIDASTDASDSSSPVSQQQSDHQNKVIGGSSSAQKKTRRTKSKRSAVVHPVSRIHRKLKKFNAGKMRIGTTAAIYAGAVLDYLVAEVLELAALEVRKDRRLRIQARHVFLAIKTDEELALLCKDSIYPGVGVELSIHRAASEEIRKSSAGFDLPLRCRGHRAASLLERHW